MSDYRPIITPAVSEAPQAPKGDGLEPVSETKIEPPFTSYEQDKGKPFVVDYYELGRYWDETDMYTQGYKPEVESINEYLNHLINIGEINNTLESVKGKLKSIEKMVGVKPDARTASRVGQVAAYVEFLLKADSLQVSYQSSSLCHNRFNG